MTFDSNHPSFVLKLEQHPLPPLSSPCGFHSAQSFPYDLEIWSGRSIYHCAHSLRMLLVQNVISLTHSSVSLWIFPVFSSLMCTSFFLFDVLYCFLSNFFQDNKAWIQVNMRAFVYIFTFPNYQVVNNTAAFYLLSKGKWMPIRLNGIQCLSFPTAY